jgi:D-threo-aldose 1-dehydrogenase
MSFHKRNGSASVLLPQLGLGAAAIGNLYAPVSDATAAATLDVAGEDGAWIDTAPYYGHGLSERRVGAFLAHRPGRRVRLSTKVGRRLEPNPHPPDHGFVQPDPFRPVFDYSFDGALRSFEDSLRRLGVDRVDLLLLHDIGAGVHGDRHPEVMAEAERGAWPAMRRLKAEGAVAAIGVGVNEVQVSFEALERLGPDVILLAGRHTLLDRSAERAGLLDACAEAGIAFIAAAPFNSGLLAGGAHFDYAPASEGTAARARRLAAVCQSRGVQLAAAALQFPLRHAAVASVLAGARSPAEVQAQRAGMSAELPADLWAELDAAVA